MTTNQAILLLQVYRGRVMDITPWGTHHVDMDYLSRDKLIVFYKDDWYPTPAGDAVVKNMLAIGAASI